MDWWWNIPSIHCCRAPVTNWKSYPFGRQASSHRKPRCGAFSQHQHLQPEGSNVPWEPEVQQTLINECILKFSESLFKKSTFFTWVLFYTCSTLTESKRNERLKEKSISIYLIEQYSVEKNSNKGILCKCPASLILLKNVSAENQQEGHRR